MAEKRRLRRVENKFGNDLTCLVKTESKEIECLVGDFNSLGIRITCHNQIDFELLVKSPLLGASIRYGIMEMGDFQNPTVLRTLGANELILVPPVRRGNVDNKREERAKVPELLEPLLTGPDPARINEVLIFRLFNLSSQGFRAKCSRSNRHIFQGQGFKNYKLYLPSVGEINVSFKIIDVQSVDGYLHVGCQLEEVSDADKIKLRSFLILCLLTEEKKSVHLDSGSKKFSKIIRIRRIDSQEDFDEVLRLRFEAYSGANKLTENATMQDMTDEFDRNSIILGAFMGKKLVGTIRIVFSDGQSQFPFQKYFPFPSYKDVAPLSSVEVSKLAIDPLVQGSDVLFRLFQTVAIEFVPKRSYALLMSTDSLAKNYVAIGAQKISGSVFHPVQKTEKMSLYVIETDDLKNARISALAWIFFGKEIQNFMITFGFMTKTKTAFLKLFKAPFELAPKLMRRIWRRIRSRQT